MAYSTAVFLYTQRQIVVLLSGNSVRRYMPVYSKPLTIHRGVDNQIQFQFLDQQQKPVDITGKEITCRIISYDGTEVLLKKALTPTLTVNGLSVLQLNAAEIEDIPAQKAYYSLEIPVGAFDYPVFVDQNAGARGDLNIVNSVLPAFVPSANVSIPTGQPFPNLNPNNSISNVLPNANIYYSSVINTQNNPVLTIQTSMYEYNGYISVQGSTIVDGDWYNIHTSDEYANNSDTQGYTINGYHPYVRVMFTSNTGAITNILTR